MQTLGQSCALLDESPEQGPAVADRVEGEVGLWDEAQGQTLVQMSGLRLVRSWSVSTSGRRSIVAAAFRCIWIENYVRPFNDAAGRKETQERLMRIGFGQLLDD
jgi:hypothetical protein